MVTAEELQLHRGGLRHSAPDSRGNPVVQAGYQQPPEVSEAGLNPVPSDGGSAGAEAPSASEFAGQSSSSPPQDFPGAMTLAAGSEKPADLTILAGEPYSIRVPESIGTFRAYTQGRRDFLLVTPTAGATNLGIPMLDLLGAKPGTTDLILIGDEGKSHTLRVAVKPSVSSLKAELDKSFPDCNIELSMPGDNLIMINGTVESAAQVEPIVSLLRSLVGTSGQVISGLRISGVMQVQLDVVIAYVNRTKARSLGFNFNGSNNRNYFLGQQIGNVGPTPGFGPGTGGTPTVPLLQGVASEASKGIPPTASIFTGVASANHSFFAYLEALEANNCFKVSANPSLVTLSGRPATFRVGGEQPYPVVSTFAGGTGAQFRRFGTSLVFTPLVMGNGKIRLELRPEVSRLDASNPFELNGEPVPSIISQEVHAVVEMEAGQTLILGGLLETQSVSRINKLPYLGDLPLVGVAFRKSEVVEEERELLVLATPHLVAPIDANQGPIAIPGEESRIPTNHELYGKGLGEVALDGCPPGGARMQTHRQPAFGNPYPVKPPPPESAELNGEASVEVPPGIITPMSYQTTSRPSQSRAVPRQSTSPAAPDKAPSAARSSRPSFFR